MHTHLHLLCRGQRGGCWLRPRYVAVLPVVVAGLLSHQTNQIVESSLFSIALHVSPLFLSFLFVVLIAILPFRFVSSLGPTQPHHNHTSCAGPPMEWSAWTDFVCNATCGDGYASRSRVCSGCVGACQGSALDVTTCSVGAQREWSAWATSGVCMSADQCAQPPITRFRICTGCFGSCTEGSNTDQITCNRKYVLAVPIAVLTACFYNYFFSQGQSYAVVLAF